MYKKLVTLSAVFLCAVLIASCSSKRTVVYVPGWDDQAKKHLIERSSGNPVGARAISRNKNSLRCTRLNNYFCIKDVGWNGGVGSDGAGHTAFRAGEWSVRAAARDLRRKYERGNTSAILIANAYAPWTDTVGSRSLRSGERACTIPQDIGSAAHCARQPHCNCPPNYANEMVRGTGLSIYDDLQLINPQSGRFNQIIEPVLRNMSAHETGFAIVTPATIWRGIRMERR